jgi:hypothetical protein
MANNRDAIIQFFRSKGVSSQVIAGILGNLQEESGLDPTAGNPHEGAIGLAQWEGNRRTALQNYAAQHGGSETDLNTQLGYLWHEMNTSESSAWQQVRSATSAADAAAAWDQYYERSSGSTRQQRIDYAQQFAGGHGPSGETSTLLTGDSASVGTGSTVPTLQDYQGVDSLGQLLNSVPELNHLLQQAQNGPKPWSVEKFLNAVQDSKWYKSHSDTARQVITQQANDPASYNQSLNNAKNSISNLSHQLGMSLTPAQLSSLAASALLTGNDSNQQWLTQQISHNENYAGLKNTDSLQGGMANAAGQLQKMASDYGYTWAPGTIGKFAQQIVSGGQTIDTYENMLKNWAKSTYPGLAKQIDAGQTVKDLATPYVQSMSNLLEVDPNTIDLYNPAVRKALQGSIDPGSKVRESTPLWQFEDQVRQDPRWAFTQNAKDTMSTALVKVGQDFGFAT